MRHGRSGHRRNACATRVSGSGLSLRGLAKSLGVSPSLISQVETGKTQPSVSTLYAIVTLWESRSTNCSGWAPASVIRHRPGAPRRPGPVQRASENPVLEMENGVRWERLAVGEADRPTHCW